MADNIFRLGIGIDTPLPPAGTEEHLPAAKELVHSIRPDIRVEELYSRDDFQRKVSDAFEFMPEDRSLLQPFRLQQKLEQLADKLAKMNNHAAAEFLEKDAGELLKNNDLLRMYCSLMLN